MLAGLLVALPLLAAFGSGADAQSTTIPTVTPGTTPPPAPRAGDGVDVVDVVTSTGLIDPILAQFLSDSITTANRPGTCASGSETIRCHTIALIWQLDSEGVVIPDDQYAALLQQMRTSAVPVYVWIGPTSAQLTGTATLLATAAAGVGMSPGTSIGLDGHEVNQALLVGGLRPAPTGLLSAQDAQDQKLTGGPAPTLGDFAVNIPGFETKEITKDGQTRREPVTLVRFSQLPLVPTLMHSAASPPVTYLLLTIGLALLIFELFTAGVGVAGTVGAGAFVLSCYGLAVLPIRPWALALIVLSMIAFAIDVQTGIPRFWTGAGVVLYVVGSLRLYDGVSMSWIPLLAGVVGVLLAFLSGMPSMVRTRFSTPTIGREWMVGELGRAITDIAPDGVVQIKGAQWRAYTNRATPVENLDRVRVVGIEGLVLEVEPEEGGARDYRDRRPKDERGPADDESSTTGASKDDSSATNEPESQPGAVDADS